MNAFEKYTAKKLLGARLSEKTAGVPRRIAELIPGAKRARELISTLGRNRVNPADLKSLDTLEGIMKRSPSITGKVLGQEQGQTVSRALKRTRTPTREGRVHQGLRQDAWPLHAGRYGQRPTSAMRDISKGDAYGHLGTVNVRNPLGNIGRQGRMGPVSPGQLAMRPSGARPGASKDMLYGGTKRPLPPASIRNFESVNTAFNQPSMFGMGSRTAPGRSRTWADTLGYKGDKRGLATRIGQMRSTRGFNPQQPPKVRLQNRLARFKNMRAIAPNYGKVRPPSPPRFMGA
jgi:hypothetical protein